MTCLVHWRSLREPCQEDGNQERSEWSHNMWTACGSSRQIKSSFGVEWLWTYSISDRYGFWATTVPLSPGRGHVYIHVPTADYIAFSSIIYSQLNLSFWSPNDLRPHDFRRQLDMRLGGNHFFLGGQAGQQPKGPPSLSASGPKRSLSETHRRSWLIWQSEEMAWGQRKQDVCGWLSVGARKEPRGVPRWDS